MSEHPVTPWHRLEYAFLQALFAVAFRLGYRRRLALAGWLNAQVMCPLAGQRPKMRRNLRHAFPDMPEAEIRRLLRAVPDSMARTFMEIFSGEEFRAIAAAARIEGAEGMAALDAAHRAGRPVILVSGHFGNYDVPRAVFLGRGFRMGGLYRPMDNALFNDRYVAAIRAIGEPLFPRSRRGMAEMVRFLRSGGMVGLLIDQRHKQGAPLDFFGREAHTPLSAAEMALKYDALLVPVYGVRQADGVHFDLVVEPPVARGTAEEMTQALNDSLEAQVSRHPEQWLWMHDRWGLRRAEKRAQKRAEKRRRKTGAG